MREHHTQEVLPTNTITVYYEYNILMSSLYKSDKDTTKHYPQERQTNQHRRKTHHLLQNEESS